MKKTITFNDIFLSYFLSSGEEVRHTFNDGVTFIYGENRTEGQEEQNNGSGKSALFYDSILFCLYGNTSRDLKKSEIPFNKGGRKKCIVELHLTITEGDKENDVKIYRSINPSQLTLIVNGEDISQSSAPSTQKYITNELLNGVGAEVFQQSVAMKINNTTPFLLMKKPEREKFIGGIFDLSYLKSAEKMAREDFNDLKKEIGFIESKLKGYQPNIDKTVEKIELIKRQKREREEKRKIQINKLQEDLDGINLGERPVEISFEEENNKLAEDIVKLNDAKARLEKKGQEEQLRILKEENERKRLVEEKEKEEQLREIQEENERKRKEQEEKFRLAEIDTEIKRLEKEILSDKHSMRCSKCGREFDEESRNKLRGSIEEKESRIKELKS